MTEQPEPQPDPPEANPSSRPSNEPGRFYEEHASAPPVPASYPLNRLVIIAGQRQGARTEKHQWCQESQTLNG